MADLPAKPNAGVAAPNIPSTVSTKNELKLARSLQQKKFRDQLGLFLVQGPKLVGELVRSSWPVETIYATRIAMVKHDLPSAIALPPHELDRIGTLESGNEVIAVARKVSVGPLKDLGPEELVLAMDGITDPGNLGTVLRVADWFGIKRVWCNSGSVDVYNPKCVQASMGAIFRVTVDQVDLPELLKRQQVEGATIFHATMGGASVFSKDLARKAIIVLGSESHGISAEVLQVGGQAISVPGSGGSESLNVAMAAAALCTEFSRQRGLR